MELFSIVYSNYTMQVFAWRGDGNHLKKYLGNREIIGSVTALNEDDAISLWKARGF